MVYLMRFGILADAQYADADNKPAWYDPSKTRYYRGSLSHVANALKSWSKTTNKPSFILQLGDLIDGINKDNGSMEAMTKALGLFARYPDIPTYHAVGNHELYNFLRIELASILRGKCTRIRNFDNLDSKDVILYYTFKPCHGVKLIALDCYEISVLGYNASHPNYKIAYDILKQHHGHEDEEEWDYGYKLEGLERRFLMQNGAMSEMQLKWLDDELRESDKLGEKVIVFGHDAIHPSSCDYSCLLWNYDDVLQCFRRHKSPVCYLSGHTHASGYVCDQQTGIHFIVFNGIIETNPNTPTYSTVTLYDDRLEIEACGQEISRTLKINSTWECNEKDSSHLDFERDHQEISHIY